MSKISDTLSERMGNSSVSDLFKVTDPEIVGNGEIIRDIELSKLVPFANHPFKVLNDDKMEETKDSIAKSGVLMPIIVRPISNNNSDNNNENSTNNNAKYEIVSGHRRTRACELLGLPSIPAIVRDLDDEESTILMVDSNIQREELLFSEKAFAYKLKLEAIKRKAGRPQNNRTQLGYNLENKKSIQIIAEQSNDSRNQIQRYIRLTELTKDLLNLTDEKKLPFTTAVELSYLKIDEQELLFNKIEELEVIPSSVQAKKIKEHSTNGTLNEDVLMEILYKKTNDFVKIKFDTETFSKYFPKDCREKEIKEIIIGLLDEWAARD